MNMLENINMEEVLADPSVGIVPALFFIGLLLKHYTRLPNTFIPWVLTALSVVAGLVFVQFSAAGVMVGILYSAITNLAHGLIKPAKEQI